MRPAALAWVLGVILAASGCHPDLRLAATGLRVSPDPAQPGQTVSYSFTLTVIPAHDFTVVARIDGTEQARVTRFEAVDGPFVLDVGDAGDLIARYGLGMHVGAVEVRLEDRNRTTSASRTFELQATPPPLQATR